MSSSKKSLKNDDEHKASCPECPTEADISHGFLDTYRQMKKPVNQ